MCVHSFLSVSSILKRTDVYKLGKLTPNVKYPTGIQLDPNRIFFWKSQMFEKNPYFYVN